MHLDLAELMSADHRRIEELLGDLGTDRADRFPLAHRLIDELAAHTTAEQQVFYPALRDIVPGGAGMANQAQAEHTTLREALVALETGHPGEDSFEAALESIAGCLREHIPVEENELVPALRGVIGEDKMRNLGDIYDEVRRNLPTGLQAMPPTEAKPRFRS
jgi:hemerythrin superfamily protein